MEGSRFITKHRHAVQTDEWCDVLEPAGVHSSSNWDITDPRIVYDRPCTVVCSPNRFRSIGFVNTNDFLLAISATADPTGVWRAVTIPADPGGNDFADFPTASGWTHKGCILGEHVRRDRSLAGPTLVSIPKAGC